MVNAQIEIIEGKIVFKSMTASGKEVNDEHLKFYHLKTILEDTLFKYEKEFQKTFIPTEKTIYNTPKE